MIFEFLVLMKEVCDLGMFTHYCGDSENSDFQAIRIQNSDSQGQASTRYAPEIFSFYIVPSVLNAPPSRHSVSAGLTPLPAAQTARE